MTLSNTHQELYIYIFFYGGRVDGAKPATINMMTTYCYKLICNFCKKDLVIIFMMKKSKSHNKYTY